LDLFSNNILISASEPTGNESAMRIQDLDTMQFDELWAIHEELTKLLSDRIVAEKRELEQRLAALNRVSTAKNPRLVNERASPRRYPKVLPKYCNPLSPTETWSGRGRKPRWVVAALKIGHKLDEFKIRDVESGASENPAKRGRHT
jgi:DNA-binding protein H-NS